MQVLVLGILFNFALGTVLVVAMYLVSHYFKLAANPILKPVYKAIPQIEPIFRVSGLLVLLIGLGLGYLYFFCTQEWIYKYSVDTWPSILLLGLPCGIYLAIKIFSKISGEELFIKGGPDTGPVRKMTFSGTFHKTTVTFHEIEVVENTKTGDHFGAGPTFEREFEGTEGLLPEPDKSSVTGKRTCSKCGTPIDLKKAVPQIYKKEFTFEGMKPFTLEIQAPMVVCNNCGLLHVANGIDLESAEIKACEKGKLCWDCELSGSPGDDQGEGPLFQDGEKVYVHPFVTLASVCVLLLILGWGEPNCIVLGAFIELIILYYTLTNQFQFNDLGIFQKRPLGKPYYTPWGKLKQIKSRNPGLKNKLSLKTDLVFSNKSLSIGPGTTLGYLKLLRDITSKLESNGMGKKVDETTRKIINGKTLEANSSSNSALLLLAIILISGSALVFNSVWKYTQWPETTGIILGSSMLPNRSDRSIHDKWNLKIGYQNSEGINWSTYTQFPGFHSEYWPEKSSVQIRYNPADPSQIILNWRELTGDWLLGIGFLGISLYIFYQYQAVRKFYKFSQEKKA